MSYGPKVMNKLETIDKCQERVEELERERASILAATDERLNKIAELLECDVENIEQALHTLLYANSMLEIENRQITE